MITRYDAMTPRKGRDGKTYWTKVGSMFPAKDGKDGFNLVLDALPLPDSDGRCTVSMFVPKPREGAEQRPAQQPAGNADMNDDIPF